MRQAETAYLILDASRLSDKGLALKTWELGWKLEIVSCAADASVHGRDSTTCTEQQLWRHGNEGYDMVMAAVKRAGVALRL